MSQNNFIRDLIGEKLSFRAQFDLNWDDWNFRRSILIFTKSIDWNQGLNWRNSQSMTNLQKAPNYDDPINWNHGLN